MRAFLSLGSNLGWDGASPRAVVLRGVEALAARPEVVVRRCSSVYRTAPVSPVAQPDFANLVVEAETDLEPEPLVRVALTVEAAFGRTRGIPLGPRTLDVDLLLLGDLVHASAGVSVPHPRMHERRFVLVPLADLAPDVVHPLLHESVRELLAALPPGELVRPWPADRQEHGGDHGRCDG